MARTFRPARRSVSPDQATLGLVVFLAGFTFLIHEVVWHRLLSLVLGATVTAATLVLALFMAGFGVGAFAWFLSRYLLVEPTYLLGSWEGFRHTFSAQVPALYEVTGTPRPLAYMGYFGGLFLLLRMWLHADPLRTSRLGVVATVLTVVWAILLHAVLPIPRGYMVAATATIAVQLSAPWINTVHRKRVKEQLAAGQLAEATWV